MNTIDYIVLCLTIGGIVVYGVWRTRGTNNLNAYFLGEKSMSWRTIGLSVMATQASAITFISTPGLGYAHGLAFVQNYFGLPLALIIVSAFFIPIYYKLNVFTAYEYLESRFDLKTRLLGASLFLIQRGLAAGITIFAPSIIISTLLKWDLNYTIIFVGGLVIVYTMSGGTKAVSITQKQQMIVILSGMAVVFGVLVWQLGKEASLYESLKIAGALDKLNVVDFDLDPEKRYTIWSGLTGGLFLALSYFGTDQSQVGRYLGGKDIKASRVGLMFNAVIKIPMQFFILLTGVLLFVFHIFNQPAPLSYPDSLVTKESHIVYERLHGIRQNAAYQYLYALRDTEKVEQPAIIKSKEELVKAESDLKKFRSRLEEQSGHSKTRDSDYLFLTYILNHIPHGVIGLLIAVIIAAAMSSVSSEINALASTTWVDFLNRLSQNETAEYRQVFYSKLLTLIWGMVAILFALFVRNSENLIEAVNIVGSLFYGTVLGLFLTAFFVKRVQGFSVFVGALIGQFTVLVLYFISLTGTINLGYLWYNVIGCGLTVVLSIVIQLLKRKERS